MKCSPLVLAVLTLAVPPLNAQAGLDAQLIERVRATFDPHGEFDLADKQASPVAPAELEELQPPSQALGIGGPANSSCSSSTFIPAGVVNYNPAVYSTAGAGTDLCEAPSSCDSGNGTSATVWYSYTPDSDGRVTIDTLGSSYNTVLSVYDGCGQFGPFGCIDPVEFVCNNDYFFGTTSLVTLDVEAGDTYVIKVAQLGTFGTGGLLDFNLRYAPANDVCTDAEPIAGLAYDPPLLSTQNATTDLCEPEEDCEFNGIGVSNAVWYSFLPPCDGLIDLNTNNSTYDTVLSVWDGCGEFNGVDVNCTVPNQLACDDDSGTGTASQLIGVAVQAGEEVLIKVADYNLSQGGGSLDFHFLFRSASPPVAEITAPGNFASVCDSQVVAGTASAGEDPLTEWSLEYQPTSGGAWTSIASSSNPVQAGTLATWNTTSLSEGYYLLRLTITNACGFTNSDTNVVYVDKSFTTLNVDSPQSGDVVGGTVCFDGTISDLYLSSYTVEYRPAGSGSFQPVGPGTFGQSVTNTAIVPGGWNTTGLQDGGYEVRIAGEDQCGNQASESLSIRIDNTPPTAKLLSPLDCSYVKGSVQVTGILEDANLKSWSLQHSLDGEWRTIATGSNAIVSATIATWELGGLPQCSYALRVVVTDESILNCASNQWSEHVIGVSNAKPLNGKKLFHKL